MGEERKVYGVLVGKPEGKRPYERPSVDGRMELERILGRMTRAGVGNLRPSRSLRAAFLLNPNFTEQIILFLLIHFCSSFKD
jgi:hypothetical protein